ncbi:hypothetical protein RE428_33550 [Marinobacter nanhaiticus D15-8W]|uniref:DUF1311 domain-containing protein n=1 Tax=Marinobacter nanhaiticus D15-8W TaxID=626887 RepID=N6WY61_9GAMM|nr:lysozyme inhibitor LprI family protein [Marinobacter nanhaiticus]ENO16546.1 DUF1311 domain-containing protein [Marinobacter nanhaiticus D15-8W]BES72337.1 hypothetical protein RE428_33550 [Marinobacter nanhaiticus D15-8W]
MKFAFLSGLLLLAVPFVAPQGLAETLDCSAPATTVEMNRCKAQEVETADAMLDKYLRASLDRYKDNGQLAERIESSQSAWETYRDAHCGAVYEKWSGGTIRGLMGGECRLRLTRERTHELWRSWLTYGDSTPPDLPDPSKSAPGFEISLSEAQLGQVGEKIFQNECAGKTECLVHWNRGEAFPSVGIGHFIWYPEGVDGRFVESFPDLVAFMRSQSVALPGWLAQLDPLDAPWPDRDAFLSARDSERVVSLRQFLNANKPVQAQFMFERAQASMARVVEAAPESERNQIHQNLKALTTTPGGVYALIDYVNFKGEGLADTERYNGEGWGLLQVLRAMDDVNAEAELDQFRQAAAKVLTRRAENAPKPIEKEKWLPGWLKRLETYRD